MEHFNINLKGSIYKLQYCDLYLIYIFDESSWLHCWEWIAVKDKVEALRID